MKTSDDTCAERGRARSGYHNLKVQGVPCFLFRSWRATVDHIFHFIDFMRRFLSFGSIMQDSTSENVSFVFSLYVDLIFDRGCSFSPAD